MKRASEIGLTVKVPPHVKHAIRRLAAERGVTTRAIILQALRSSEGLEISEDELTDLRGRTKDR
ncbi:hypothetical protein [Roseiterribacter gracilis]|uniref:Uncharacterized protein n=1 Tax=Roseiterribacter gracilis TaxID=2812848 RepID=A0A8S8XH24_9PROT|nr:hypothetical protein TMPK1_30340 [Rhodospirillales bacterium TMPK1]